MYTEVTLLYKRSFTLLGWYIYFETSNPVRTGDYAIIQSELRQATDALCVSFWYNMYGAGMGKLLMGIIKPSSDNLDNVFWSKEGNNGKDWKQASVTVKYAQRFHVCMYVCMCVYVCVCVCVYVCVCVCVYV